MILIYIAAAFFTGYQWGKFVYKPNNQIIDLNQIKERDKEVMNYDCTCNQKTNRDCYMCKLLGKFNKLPKSSLPPLPLPPPPRTIKNR